MADDPKQNNKRRLYSQDATPEQQRLNRAWMQRGTDEIYSEHQAIHQDLVRWGQWNRDRYQPASCASIEKLYSRGGDTTPPATAPMAVNPMNLRIEHAVLRMLFQHQESTKLYYIKRRKPTDICHIFHIKFEDFSKWMGDCRTMVIYLLEN